MRIRAGIVAVGNATVREVRSPRRDAMTAQADRARHMPLSTLTLVALLGVVVLWSYWTTLASVVWRWAEDPQYSHGWLVPLFAGYLLWLRRNKYSQEEFRING